MQMPDLKGSQNILNQIASIMPNYCEKCGEQHSKDDLEIVFSDKTKAVCKLSCKNCAHSSMIHFNSPLEGIIAAKRSNFKSEITAQEITKFSNSEEISSDELISVFKGLKAVSTIEDFNKLVN